MNAIFCFLDEECHSSMLYCRLYTLKLPIIIDAAHVYEEVNVSCPGTVDLSIDNSITTIVVLFKSSNPLAVLVEHCVTCDNFLSTDTIRATVIHRRL
jgi:hypothetical protein